jgi:hypothetical protein
MSCQNGRGKGKGKKAGPSVRWQGNLMGYDAAVASCLTEVFWQEVVEEAWRVDEGQPRLNHSEYYLGLAEGVGARLLELAGETAQNVQSAGLN